jgi:hypothetical protein
MNSVFNYFREVLGVESWIGSGKGFPVVEIVPSCLVSVVLKRSWKEAERSISEKMLSAANLGESAQVIFEEDGPWPNSLHILIFDSEELGREQLDSQILWKLGPLAKLLSGPAAEVQASKREVWNLLKALQNEISRDAVRKWSGS